MDSQTKPPAPWSFSANRASASDSGEPIWQPLENLRHPNPRVRRSAVQEMSTGTDTAALERLIDVAQHDPDLEVRCAAILGLGQLLYGEANSAYDPETDQEIAPSAGALSREDLKCIYDLLLSVCRNPESALDEKRCAVEAESYFSNDTVEDLIAQLYAGPEKAAKLSALIAMGRNGSPRWAEILRREMYGPDRDLQIEAITAAGEMSLDSLGKDLWRLTYSEDRIVMLAALWALGQTGWDGAFERLDELTLDEDPEIADAADEAMDEWLFYNGLNSESSEEEDALFPDTE
jgi:HEAT repeat protein